MESSKKATKVINELDLHQKFITKAKVSYVMKNIY